MKAVILCAGRGTRLANISKHIPKPMISIDGKPLLESHIYNCKKFGITDIFINLYHKPEKITEYFKDGKKFGVSITYSYEKKLLGTGGALTPLSKFLDDDTLILYGDIYADINLQKLFTFHKKKKAIITAVIHKATHPEDSDLVEFDKRCKLTRIVKKPHTNIPKTPYNLAALYVFSPEAFKLLPQKTPFDIAHDILPLLLVNKKNVFCYNTEEFIMDIGTPERLENITKRLSL